MTSFVDARQQPGPRAEYIIRAKEDRSTLGAAIRNQDRGRIAKYGPK